MAAQSSSDSSSVNKPEIKSRNDVFAEKLSTKIWKEVPSEANPYISTSALCHGYDLFELMEKRSFVDVLFLLLKGELPNESQRKLLEQVMIAFINPGPRDYGGRAAIDVGNGKSRVEHILPIALGVIGGEHLGGLEVSQSLKFLQSSIGKSPADVLESLRETTDLKDTSDIHIAPGFGRRLGSIDEFVANKAKVICRHSPTGGACQWGQEFNELLNAEGFGWLSTGLCAAVFLDLEFDHRTATCMFQLINAPGLIAHAVEVSYLPITDLPFVGDDNYFIE